MKTAKVISVWGGRRAWQDEDYSVNDNLKMLELTVQHERGLDYGTQMDLILTNSIDENPKKEYKKFIEFIDSLDGTKTKNGNIKVLHRENIGISNGAFDYTFQNYIDEYDYWYFSEDDRINVANGVMSIAVDMLENKNDAGFVCTTGIRRNPNKKFYVLGSSGVTSTKVLKKVLDLGLNREGDGTDHLPFCWKKPYKRRVREGAYCWHRATHDFTRLIHYELGLSLHRLVYNGVVLDNYGVSMNYGSFLAQFHPEFVLSQAGLNDKKFWAKKISWFSKEYEKIKDKEKAS